MVHQGNSVTYEFLIFYIVGLLLSLALFWRIDQHSLAGKTMGFTMSLFLSVILGMIIGYGYALFLVFEFISNIWDKQRI